MASPHRYQNNSGSGAPGIEGTTDDSREANCVCLEPCVIGISEGDLIVGLVLKRRTWNRLRSFWAPNPMQCSSPPPPDDRCRGSRPDDHEAGCDKDQHEEHKPSHFEELGCERDDNRNDDDQRCGNLLLQARPSERCGNDQASRTDDVRVVVRRLDRCPRLGELLEVVIEKWQEKQGDDEAPFHQLRAWSSPRSDDGEPDRRGQQVAGRRCNVVSSARCIRAPSTDCCS